MRKRGEREEGAMQNKKSEERSDREEKTGREG